LLRTNTLVLTRLATGLCAVSPFCFAARTTKPQRDLGLVAAPIQQLMQA
jgi:hypothetical protein